MESLEKRMLERGITSFTDTSTGEVTTPEEPQLGVKLTDDDDDESPKGILNRMPLKDYTNPDALPDILTDPSINTKGLTIEDYEDIKNRYKGEPDGFEKLVQIHGDPIQAMMIYNDLPAEDAQLIYENLYNKVNKIDATVPFEQSARDKFIKDQNRIEKTLAPLYDVTSEGKMQYPHTLRWFADPVNAAMSRDKVKIYKDMEAAVLANKSGILNYNQKFRRKAWEKGIDFLQNVAETIGTSIDKGKRNIEGALDIDLSKLPQLPEGTNIAPPGMFPEAPGASFLDIMTAPDQNMFEGEVYDMLRDIDDLPPWGDIYKDVILPKYTKSVTGAHKAFQGIIDDLDYSPLPKSDNAIEEFTLGWGGLLTQYAYTYGAYAINPVLGTIPIAFDMFGGISRNIRAQGGTEDAAFYGGTANLVFGLPAELVEMAAFGKLLASFGTGGQIAAMLNSAGINIAQESYQGVVERLIEKVALADQNGMTPREAINDFWGTEFKEALSEGMKEGLTVATFQLLTFGLMQGPMMMKQIRDEKNQKTRQDMQALAVEAKFNTEGPAANKNYLESMPDMPKNVGVPVTKIEEYFQEDFEGATAMAKALGIEEQLEIAKGTREDIIISYPDWITHMSDTDFALKVDRDISVDSTPSLNDQEIFKKDAPELLKNLIQEAQDDIIGEELPPQLATIRERLMLPKEQGGAGFEAQYADDFIELVRSSARITSRELGESEQEWNDRVNLMLETGGVYTPPDGVTEANRSVTYDQEGALEINENFTNWFGKSQLTDEKGAPITLHHATNRKFSIFGKDKIGENWPDRSIGYHFAETAEQAAMWVPDTDTKIDMEVYGRMEQPFEATPEMAKTLAANPELLKGMQDNGYDGIIVDHQGAKEYIFFHANQIKSVNNKGDFSTINDDIYYQVDSRFSQEFVDWFGQGVVLDTVFGREMPRPLWRTTVIEGRAVYTDDMAVPNAAVDRGQDLEQVATNMKNPMEITQSDIFAAFDERHPLNAEGELIEETDEESADMIPEFIANARELNRDGLIIRDYIVGPDMTRTLYIPFDPSGVRTYPAEGDNVVDPTDLPVALADEAPYSGLLYFNNEQDLDDWLITMQDVEGFEEQEYGRAEDMGDGEGGIPVEFNSIPPHLYHRMIEEGGVAIGRLTTLDGVEQTIPGRTLNNTIPIAPPVQEDTLTLDIAEDVPDIILDEEVESRAQDYIDWSSRSILKDNNGILIKMHQVAVNHEQAYFAPTAMLRPDQPDEPSAMNLPSARFVDYGVLTTKAAEQNTTVEAVLGSFAATAFDDGYDGMAVTNYPISFQAPQPNEGVNTTVYHVFNTDNVRPYPTVDPNRVQQQAAVSTKADLEKLEATQTALATLGTTGAIPYTITFLNNEMLIGKEGKNVKVGTLKQILNQKQISTIEKDIVNFVLEQDEFKGQKSVSFDVFKLAIQQELLPLEAIAASGYQDYGASKLAQRPGNWKTIVYNSPIKHGYSAHFSELWGGQGEKKNYEVIQYPAPNEDIFVALDRNRPGNIQTEAELGTYVGTAGSKEQVELWIKAYNERDFSREISGEFGHARRWWNYDFDPGLVRLPEIQADVYQRMRKLIPGYSDTDRYGTIDENLKSMIMKAPITDRQKELVSDIKIHQAVVNQLPNTADLEAQLKDRQKRAADLHTYIEEGEVRHNEIAERIDTYVARIAELKEKEPQDVYDPDGYYVAWPHEGTTYRLKVPGRKVEIEGHPEYDFFLHQAIDKEDASEDAGWIVSEKISGKRIGDAVTSRKGAIKQAKDTLAKYTPENLARLMKDAHEDPVKDFTSFSPIDREIAKHEINLKEAQESLEANLNSTTNNKQMFHDVMEHVNKIKTDIANSVSPALKEKTDKAFKLLKKAEKQLPKTYTLFQKQFQAHRKNYTPRLIREEIKWAALNGKDKVQIATPYTNAVGEGFVPSLVLNRNAPRRRTPAAPAENSAYIIRSARQNNYLEPGDVIQSQEDGNEWVITESFDEYFEALPIEDRTNYYRLDELIDDELRSRLDDTMYELPDTLTADEVSDDDWWGEISGSTIRDYIIDHIDNNNLVEEYNEDRNELISNIETMEEEIGEAETERDKLQEELEAIEDSDSDEYEYKQKEIDDKDEVIEAKEEDRDDLQSQLDDTYEYSDTDIPVDTDDLRDEIETYIEGAFEGRDWQEYLDDMGYEVAIIDHEEYIHIFDSTDNVLSFPQPEFVDQEVEEPGEDDDVGDGNPPAELQDAQGQAIPTPDTLAEEEAKFPEVTAARKKFDEEWYTEEEDRPDGSKIVILKHKQLSATQWGGVDTYREIGEWLKKEYGDAFSIIIDENGYQWYQILLTPDMRMQAILLYQENEENISKGPQGSIQITDEGTLINLFETMDFSTPPHEWGHRLVKEMENRIDFAEQNGIDNQQLKADYEYAREFVGGEFNKKGHEKFADSFLKYLSEGKAPNQRLLDVFRRMKEWLTALYKKLFHKINLTDEMRGVFDRLLATDAEIKAAKQHYKAKDEYIDLIPATEPQKKTLRQAKEKSNQTALDKQMKKTLGTYMKLVGGKPGLKKRAAAKLGKEPVYMAITRIVEQGGLSSQEVKSRFGEAAVLKLKTNDNKLAKQNGTVSISQAALDNKFDSEEDMMDLLTNTKPFGQAVNDMVDQMVQEAEAGIKDRLTESETVQGDEAIHNQDEFEYQVAVANTLANILIQQGKKAQRSLTTKAYRDAADEIIDGKPVKTATRYDSYAKTEEKYAKEQLQAMRENDLDKAYTAQKTRLINHAMVQSAVRARDAKKKMEKYYAKGKILKKINGTSKKLDGIEYSYAEVALDLIGFYGLADVAPNSPVTDKTWNNLDDDVLASIPEWIRNKNRPEVFKDWKDLTMGEAKELDAAIRSIISNGSDEIKSMQLEGIETVRDFVAAAQESTEKLKDVDANNKHTKWGRMMDNIDAAISEVVILDFFFERLDGYKFGKTGLLGNHRELSYRGIQAEVQTAQMKQQVFDAAEKPLHMLTQAIKRLHKGGKGPTFSIPGVPVTAEMKRVGYYDWTGEMVVSYILNMGNDGNMQSLKNAYEFTQEQVDTLTGLFTKAELNAVQEVWDAIDIMYKPQDAVYFRMFNRHLAKVEAAEVVMQASDGEVTLRGGYYPLSFDFNMSTQAARNNETQMADDILKNMTMNVHRSTKPNDSATFARTPGHSLPPKLSLSVFTGHVNAVARYTAFSEYLRDLNRITLDETWKRLVEAKESPEAYRAIRHNVAHQARPDRRVLDEWTSTFFENLRNASTFAILAPRIAVGLKQRLSGFSAVDELGWKWILVGAGQAGMTATIFGTSTSAGWDKVISKSPAMKLRDGHWDRGIDDVLGPINPLKGSMEIGGHVFTNRDVKEAMFTFIRMNDRATVGVVWLGAYNKFLHDHTEISDENERHDKAVAFADNIIPDTQPGSLPAQLSKAQTSEGFMRFITPFMTWTIKAGNRVRGNYKQWKDGEKTTASFFKHAFYEWFMAPAAAQTISSVWRQGELPNWWDLMLGWPGFFMSFHPLTRELWTNIVFLSRGGQPVTAMEGFYRVAAAGAAAWAAVAGDDEDRWLSALWDMGKLVELVLKIPALTFVEDVNRAVEANLKAKER